MGKRNGGYNIIVTNSTYGEIFSMKLGVKRLYTLLTFFIVVPILFVLFLFFAPRVYHNSADVEKLTAENSFLQAQVDSINHIKRNLINIDQYSRYLRTVAQLKGAKELPSLSDFVLSDSVKRVLVGTEPVNITNFTPALKPVVGGVIARGFIPGSHEAVDISAGRGKTILAAASGVVKKLYSDEFLGNVIVLDHGGEYTTLYAHCATILKQENSKVKRGDPIATVGSTGSETTGPHLHYEVRNREGVAINPEPLFGK